MDAAGTTVVPKRGSVGDLWAERVDQKPGDRKEGPRAPNTPGPPTTRPAPFPEKVSEMSSGCSSQAPRPKVTSPLAASPITYQGKKGLANCIQDSNHSQGTRYQLELS